ncbi:DNA mismatch repair endonuclease MutL [Candidatus Woesearchaeota archaeon]|jgi:DNA mismatch repair protein MutL|nr:DNA mismatch repair endonuclease MutL [Candidatus Woesearchaeota archaeon]MBT4150993.1 DNA mismatch repair endonuclease MutL [Candidatus Woesearchaeota archaeon]MBT4247238.1 DNA mismatch repair endonuclease MutL [Candidatus Woesearchaeota archaeon]MBT4433783.1 DNA mismatch repair endonuclease MutL [Candidatus Woesearchaeota archaeon]MBT7332650.1 DNA mismatch repair endonuclease MutL [Candidatus Woesearchaeota archaeon]
MTINILSEDLINKIAAGEVVERPASVVKELIENALDADATSISVDIKNSGQDLIKITDNGKGMSEEDARKSVLRHATSKIRNTEDLFSIETLGFRGEALASIAAISQFSLITKQKDLLEGFNLVLEGGQVISEGAVGCDQGTTIEIRNLFYNTPVRKKFLKTDAVELRHIIDVVTHYALLHETVDFKLTHENHELLNAPSTDDLQSNIASIYGVSIAKELLEIDYEDDLVRIEGLTCKPLNARNDKHQQVFFVNNRWVRSKELTDAVYEGYKSRLFVNKHPIFVLSLTLNPQNVDVNVHPQKMEIKIDQIDEVRKAVTQSVIKVLEKHNLIPLIDVESEALTMGSEVKKTYAFDPSAQTTLKVEETTASYADSYDVGSYVTPEEEVIEERNYENISEPVKEVEQVIEKLPSMKIFGQVHKTFFVAETEGGVLFIDQHAAHERVMYEKFMKQFKDASVDVQELLQGGVLELTAAEKVLVEENLEALGKLGFSVEPFGGNTFILKSVPSVFGRLQPYDLFQVVLHELVVGRNSIQELKETIITRMACRSAVMAGDELSKDQMQNIVNDLEKTDFPYTCPHGRPTMIKTEAFELEKKFKRCG